MNWKKSICVFLIAATGGAASLGVSNFLEKESQPAVMQATPTPVRYASFAPGDKLPDLTGAAEMSVHTVVHIKSTYENVVNDLGFYDPFSLFFGQPQQPQRRIVPQTASGSGVIISPDGYIVTNNHVIDQADKVEVILDNKSAYTARVVGTDPTTDLALLKIEEKNLPFITYGNSDNVRVGEWVLAVGNPFNLTSTVTAGIVSAKGRSINILGNDPDGITPIESFIQTDAAVNVGNSGGALVNTNGELIGINSAIASTTGAFAGYSFAIPVNIVQKVTRDLVEFGEVQRAFLGVSIRDIDAALVKEKNLDRSTGVYVAGVSEGGAAQNAGLAEGDIIVKIGASTINTLPELQEHVGRYRPGDKIMVTVMRRGSEKIVPMTLRNRNGNTEIFKKSTAARETSSTLGASFETASSEELKRLNIQGGVKIASLNGGKLRSAGIREGFIITRIDKKEVKSADDIPALLENKKGGVLIEGVYPNGMRAYYGFGL